jgi:glycosyltransferase involved in cell wall biosynthesis
MLPVALEAGVGAEKIFRIPIGFDPALFPPRTEQARLEARRRLGLPESAVIVGSFQKDGDGWGEGDQPKWVKGPDVLVRTLSLLRKKFPELMVLLSGPSRGYVKKALQAEGIPFRHHFLKDYRQIGELYRAIDLYIVSSREEGGPKAVLESMASGVPLVTTRVGQAIDLVRTRENAVMVPVDDAEALAFAAESVLQDSTLRERVIREGLATAAGETYEAQIPRWREYFKGFVES